MRRLSSTPLTSSRKIQQSFYKQCPNNRVAADSDSSGESDENDDYQADVFEHVEEISNGESSVNDEEGSGFTYRDVNNGKLLDEEVFDTENPCNSLSASKDPRRISVTVQSTKSMELVPPIVDIKLENDDVSCSHSASSIGIKISDRQLLKPLSGLSSDVNVTCICASRNSINSFGGNLLLAGASNGVIYVFHSVMQTLMATLVHHSQSISALLSIQKEQTSGKLLVSGCLGGIVMVWDLDSKAKVKQIGDEAILQRNGISSLASRKHDHCETLLLIVGYVEGSISVWDFEKNTLVYSLQGHNDSVTALDVVEKESISKRIADDFVVISCSKDCTIHIYDFQGQADEKVKKSSFRKMLSMKNRSQHSPSSSFYHISTENAFDGRHSSRLEPSKILRGHENAVRKFVVRPKQSCRNKGHYLISCGDDCTVRYWDIQSEAEVRILRGHSDRIVDIQTREIDLNLKSSADSNELQNFFLVTCSHDRTVVIWDGISGVALRCLLGHKEEVHSICLIEKDMGMFNIASGGLHGEVIVWNIDCELDNSTLTLVEPSENCRKSKSNDIESTLQDRSLLCIQVMDQTDSTSGSLDVDQPRCFHFFSSRHSSTTINHYQCDERCHKRNLKTSSVSVVDLPVCKGAPNKEGTFITSLGLIYVARPAKYNILVGLSNGQIGLFDCNNSIITSYLSDYDDDEDMIHSGRDNAVVAMSVREVFQEESPKSQHVIAARSNGTITVWDFDSKCVSSHFRDFEDDTTCVTTLEINFALLDSLSDGGFRYASGARHQNAFDYGIVTGCSAGKIKIWKYDSFSKEWLQCFEIDTIAEEANGANHGISSICILWKDLLHFESGHDTGIRRLNNFQLVVGHFDGAINIWNLEDKTITLVIEEPNDADLIFHKLMNDFAVTQVTARKVPGGYDIVCGKNNGQVLMWRNIDINNVPGYGNLCQLVKRKNWFSLHILFKRFGWMLFNAWQSNAETLFIYTIQILKNRQISKLVKDVCYFNELHHFDVEGDCDKFTPSHCWLGVKTKRHSQSILSACVEKRIYDDIKFTLDAWCQVLNSDSIDLFDELQDSFHFHLSLDDLLLVSESYASLFCEFLVNIKSRKSHDWLLGGRVRDQFRKRDDNMKMKSFDKWYMKKFLSSKQGIWRGAGCSPAGDVPSGKQKSNDVFWDNDHMNDHLAYLDIIEGDGLSLISFYERMERDTELEQVNALGRSTLHNWLFQVKSQLIQSIRTHFGQTMDKRKARSQVLIEGRFLSLRNTLGGDLTFLRACLSTQNVEIFDSEVLHLTVDYAWRAYGRRAHFKHFFVFLCFLFFAAVATFNFDWLLERESKVLAVFPPKVLGVGLQLALGVVILYHFYLEVAAVSRSAKMSNFAEAIIFYFGDIWNIVDLTSYSCNIVGVAVRLVNMKDTTISRISFAISSVLMWLKLLYFMRAFKSTGPLVSMILQILFESRFFLLILFIALCGFAQAFLVMEMYGTVSNSLLRVFAMMLGDFELEFSNSAQASITALFFVLFMVIVTVVFLNLLIAIMGDSYDRIKEKEIAQWRREQAKSIVDETLLIPNRRMKRKERSWFPSTLHILRPLDKLSGTIEGAEWQGKIAQIRQVIDASTASHKKDIDKHNYRIEVLGSQINCIEESTKKIEGKLSQKVDVLSERVVDLIERMNATLQRKKLD